MTEHTRHTSLGELCKPDRGGLIQTGPFGSQLHASDYTTTGTPVVMPANIADNRIDTSGIARVGDDHTNRLSRHRLRPGDVVYSRRGDITRRALVREEETDWLCGTGCLLVRPGADVDPRWLSFWLGAPWTHDYLLQRAVGATMANLNTGILSGLPVSLPPLEEQRRIAGVLGALDDLAAECERLASACVALADSLWQRLQADATRSCAFGEIAALSRTRVASDAAADLPFIGLEHLREAGGGLMGSGRLSDVSSGAVAFEGGDVLYGKLRPYFRKFARPGFAGGASPEIWVLSPKGSATHSLLHAVVSSPRFTDHAMAGAGGTRMPRASWSHVADFRLSLPDDEQAKSVERVASALWEAHWQLADEMVQARTTRDELLPLLLSGRVRVGEVAA